MQIEQKTNRIYKPQSNTTLSAEETNQVTTELENVITAGGLTPNAGTLTQVRDAIQNVVDTSANDLQEQIDAITSASDVFDVVGTYAQLQAYDTSTVPVNDIIKVLQDETRNNAMTYYRWNGTAWVFVGAEGPYYTVAETDTKFATKAQLPGVATTQQVGLIKPDGTTTQVAADGTLTFSQSVLAALPLFTHQFVDHLLNDPSYLRADTFSWQSGSVYVSAYQHLVDDIAGVTAETETISGTTITFYRATDGHKVVLADQESNVSAIYTATGIAWYYVLDTDNTRFKLPRSQWAFVGLRDTVGNYVEAGLPNITGEQKSLLSNSASDLTSTGALYVTPFSTTIDMSASSSTRGRFLFLDASRSNATYGKSSTVQQKATQMYLYFYCGNTVINQTTVDVGEITEELNYKADTDLSNLSATGEEKFDGSWTAANIVLNDSEVSVAAQGSVSFDISSNFESGKVYELVLSLYAKSGSTSGDNVDFRVSSNLMTTPAMVCANLTRTSAVTISTGSVLLPYNGGSITISSGANQASTLGRSRITAYRRVK